MHSTANHPCHCTQTHLGAFDNGKRFPGNAKFDKRGAGRDDSPFNSDDEVNGFYSRKENGNNIFVKLSETSNIT